MSNLKTNPFDFVKSITGGGKHLMKDTENDELAEKSYSPFLTNRALSYYSDTISYANMMNQFNDCDNLCQYEFFINTVRPMRRKSSKWSKPVDSVKLDMIMEYYGYSRKKAEQALTILTEDEMKYIKKKMDKGG